LPVVDLEEEEETEPPASRSVPSSLEIALNWPWRPFASSWEPQDFRACAALCALFVEWPSLHLKPPASSLELCRTAHCLSPSTTRDRAASGLG